MTDHLPQDLVGNVQKLYLAHKAHLASLSSLRYEQSSLSGDISEARLRAKPISPETLSRASNLKKDIHRHQAETDQINQQLLELAQLLPNDSHPSVPRGSAEAARLLHEWHGPNGLIPPDSGRDHLALGSQMGLIDMEAGSKVTGSSWAYLLNEATLLEHAIITYALAIAVKHRFRVASTPDVIRSDFALRCGYQPREERAAIQQAYALCPTELNLVLSGTAEIPLAGMHANSLLDLSQGPIKHVAAGKAFRVEAGARGRESRGLYRLHQFSKVELFAVSDRESSDTLMSEMLAVQMEVIQGLGLPYRVMDMPTEELGASAFRKYDIDVWMPGRGTWGEVSSLSNCTDYQSRRLHIRYRDLSPPDEDSGIEFAHTLNGTAAAIPRLLLALLENGAQFEDGVLRSLALPVALKQFWLGTDRLTHRQDLEIRWF